MKRPPQRTRAASQEENIVQIRYHALMRGARKKSRGTPDLTHSTGASHSLNQRQRHQRDYNPAQPIPPARKALARDRAPCPCASHKGCHGGC